MLLIAHPVPVVPVYIAGRFAAWPWMQRLQGLRHVAVVIGEPVDTSAVVKGVAPDHQPAVIADLLRAQVQCLAESTWRLPLATPRSNGP